MKRAPTPVQIGSLAAALVALLAAGAWWVAGNPGLPRLWASVANALSGNAFAGPAASAPDAPASTNAAPAATSANAAPAATSTNAAPAATSANAAPAATSANAAPAATSTNAAPAATSANAAPVAANASAASAAASSGGGSAGAALDTELVSQRVPAGNRPANAFAPKSWLVAAPPPPPPPPLPVVLPPPAPPPQAPPLPFKYVGVLHVSPDHTLWYLLSGERLIIAATGEVIDNTHRIDGADAGQLRFTYMPLAQRQSLAIGGTP